MSASVSGIFSKNIGGFSDICTEFLNGTFLSFKIPSCYSKLEVRFIV
jgi:hypothetical protein